MKKIIFLPAVIVCVCALLTACSSTTVKQGSLLNPSEGMNATSVTPNPTAANLNVQLGMGYLQQGDVERAKRKLLLAIAQAPNWAPAQDAMAYFLENTGEPQNAETYYKKAIALDPTSGAGHNNYGAFLCRTNRYQEADQQFMLAVQDVNYIHTAEAYENAGLCAMKIPDFVKAQGYFQKAIAQDPHRTTSYLELAQITFNQKNYPQTQQYLNQYLQAVPEPNPESLWLAVRLARAQNDQTTAGKYAVMLLTRFPTSNETKWLKAAKIPTNQPNTQLKIPGLLSS